MIDNINMLSYTNTVMKFNYLLIYLIFMEEGATKSPLKVQLRPCLLSLQDLQALSVLLMSFFICLSYCPKVTPLQLVTSGSVDVKCDSLACKKHDSCSLAQTAYPGSLVQVVRRWFPSPFQHDEETRLPGVCITHWRRVFWPQSV